MNDGIWRTVAGRRIFIKNGQDLSEAMKESGKFTNNGLSANDNNTHEKHKGPILLKRIDLDKENIKEVLKNYENLIKDDKIENAIVITKEGEIYQCFGNESNVWVDEDLGNKIQGAFITHNHPINQTSYSFSNKDVELFEKYQLSVLRGVDNKYTYELDRNERPSLANPTWNDTIEDSSFYHINCINYAINNNISYKRWKNE